MKSVPPLDVFDKPINVGDTVVYSVYTRNGGLQKGEVVALVPYVKKSHVKNPNFNPNAPRTYPPDYTNPTYFDEEEQHFKIKVKIVASRFQWDEVTNKGEYVDYETTKTLDTPGRFAVMS